MFLGLVLFQITEHLYTALFLVGIGRNSFSSTIPSEIGNLTSLEYLDLSKLLWLICVIIIVNENLYLTRNNFFC